MSVTNDASVTAYGADRGLAAGEYKISGDKTVVIADSDKFAFYVGNSSVDIQSPLFILEPDGGEIKANGMGYVIYTRRSLVSSSFKMRSAARKGLSGV